jgi:hypothetical protein
LNRRVTCDEATVAKEGTIMKSTMVPTSDSWVRPVRVDMGWPACDERLVTVAGAIGAESALPPPSCPSCVEPKEDMTPAMARDWPVVRREKF